MLNAKEGGIQVGAQTCPAQTRSVDAGAEIPSGLELLACLLCVYHMLGPKK